MPVRPFAAGRFLLQLEGASCGYVQSVEGGGATAEVIQEIDSEFFVKKRLGALKYEDITMTIGFSMSSPVYDWIAASLRMEAEPMNGAIILADQNYEAKSEQQFVNALVTEVGFPAPDASSKEAGYLTIKIAPERTRNAKASGNVTDRLDRKQKQWVSSNFRLEIDGLDCSKVAKIDAFTVKQATAPGKIEFPNLAITLAEVSSETWREWHEDFVIKGNNGEGQEKQGKLAFLAPTGRETLLTISFHGLGIFKLRRERSEVGADRASQMIAELYCERMELAFG